MEFKELIIERKSIRRYREGCTIPRETLADILKDAAMAPTWKNSQTGRCYAVTDPETLAKLRQEALPSFNANSSANAAALLVTTFVRKISGFNGDEPANECGDEWGAYDLGLRDAYLVLSAKDHGYDTLIMGIRDGEKIRSLLGVPETEEIVSVIAVGVRDQEPAPRPRKDLAETVRFF